MRPPNQDPQPAQDESRQQSENVPRRGCVVHALMNQKGGVGKTTTTVNLAAGCAERGQRVLVIDLDPQAHASLHMGVEDDGLPTVYDLLLEGADRDGMLQAVRTTRDRLHVLPATVDLAAAETELAGATRRHHRLASILQHVAGDYDMVVLDCPPSLGLLTLNALAAADEVVIPMQAHFLALQGVGKLLETVRMVRGAINPRLLVGGVVLCMHDENTRHTREVVTDLTEFFAGSRGQDVPWANARVLRPAVRRNIKLAEAPSFGQTIFEYEPTCAGAADYLALAESLLSGDPGVSGDAAADASGTKLGQAAEDARAQVEVEIAAHIGVDGGQTSAAG